MLSMPQVAFIMINAATLSVQGSLSAAWIGRSAYISRRQQRSQPRQYARSADNSGSHRLTSDHKAKMAGLGERDLILYSDLVPELDLPVLFSRTKDRCEDFDGRAAPGTVVQRRTHSSDGRHQLTNLVSPQ